MKTNDIVTISDVCADLLLFGDDIMPEFGQKEKLGSRYYLTMGGSCGIACKKFPKSRGNYSKQNAGTFKKSTRLDLLVGSGDK